MMKPKFEFSKIIVAVILLIMLPTALYLTFKVISIAELSVYEKFSGALPYLTTITTAVWASMSTIIAFYFNKAKVENKVKLQGLQQSRNIDC